ncbi:MAG: hypothetical protein AAB657_04755 [Patescibacteria group bacterium]
MAKRGPFKPRINSDQPVEQKSIQQIVDEANKKHNSSCRDTEYFYNSTDGSLDLRKKKSPRDLIRNHQ